MEQYKINLHITESCNYRCGYCFAHFGKKKDLPVDAWKKIIRNIKGSGLINAINFAGGEPVLYRGFSDLTMYAKSEGFDLSIISNGSLLLNPTYTPSILFKEFSTLGISIDSFNPHTLCALGCCDAKKKTLSTHELKEIVAAAKEINPEIKIKLNTVVSKCNKDELIPHIEEDLPISRWKFFKIKEFDDNNFSNVGLLITDQEFDVFMNRNKRVRGETIAERTLTRSYIMVDSQGNLVDDFGSSYQIVGNLLSEDFTEVFHRYKLDKRLYHQRY